MASEEPRVSEHPRSPAAQLRAELRPLSDLLIVKPLPRRDVLRPRVRAALDLCEAAGADGLPCHLLRNLLRDLGERRGTIDARYYAGQLTLLADRLDG